MKQIYRVRVTEIESRIPYEGQGAAIAEPGEFSDPSPSPVDEDVGGGVQLRQAGRRPQVENSAYTLRYPEARCELPTRQLDGL